MGSSVWGGAAEAWSGWGAALRPPPGFPAAPPPARVYDPFHSLSDIWAPNVLQWSEAPPTAPTAPAPAPDDTTRQDSPR